MLDLLKLCLLSLRRSLLELSNKRGCAQKEAVLSMLSFLHIEISSRAASTTYLPTWVLVQVPYDITSPQHISIYTYLTARNWSYWVSSFFSIMCIWLAHWRYSFSVSYNMAESWQYKRWKSTSRKVNKHKARTKMAKQKWPTLVVLKHDDVRLFVVPVKCNSTWIGQRIICTNRQSHFAITESRNIKVSK